MSSRPESYTSHPWGHSKIFTNPEGFPRETTHCSISRFRLSARSEPPPYAENLRWETAILTPKDKPCTHDLNRDLWTRRGALLSDEKGLEGAQLPACSAALRALRQGNIPSLLSRPLPVAHTGAASKRSGSAALLSDCSFLFFHKRSQIILWLQVQLTKHVFCTLTNDLKMMLVLVLIRLPTAGSESPADVVGRESSPQQKGGF